jgi:aspartyl-tRNA(Asn)/glutamyl-tRNA(Gln) amidotransferase subunit A
LRAELQGAMAGLDVVITAGAPGEAPKLDAIPRWDVFANPSFTMPFNVSGYPAIAVCSGFGPAGLPVSLQIAGKPFQEATVFQVADAFEKATDFRSRRPAMVA